MKRDLTELNKLEKYLKEHGYKYGRIDDDGDLEEIANRHGLMRRSMQKGWRKMARTEKDFLNTLETYVKITQDRLRDGRIIDAHDELGLIEIMIDQRRQEVEGTASWDKTRSQKESKKRNEGMYGKY